MPTRDLIDNITTILAWTDLDGVPDEARGYISEEAENERAELAEGLRRAWDEGDEDPLLVSLARARGRMLDAERDLRLLIAYAREFTEPRPYRLEDLARAAGMSVSGIRTAYDADEIGQVAEMTGLTPRRSVP
jgi:AraC-like DNA-binding protein